MKRFLLIVCLALSGQMGFAQPVETPAKHALIEDFETGAVVLEKAADERFPPASMAKMMTVYLVFEQLAQGSLSLDDTFIVSDQAWRRWVQSEGSKMFVQARDAVSVRDLLQGIIVSSGNDASTVVAEGLAGTEDAFADWMTQRAQELGMTNTRFQNASGWPAEDQYTTARDLAILVRRTIEDFPQLYEYYKQTEFTYGTSLDGQPIKQGNRNPLLYSMDGVVDGLKTGHTEAAGYGLAASGERNGRRLILVVAGLSSVRERARESQRLMNFAFRNFDNYRLFEQGEEVALADVWLGEQPKVPLVVDNSVVMTLSRRQRADLRAVLRYDSPVAAPVERGQPLATVTLSAPGMVPVEVPLSAGRSIAAISGFGKIGAALEYMIFGASGG